MLSDTWTFDVVAQKWEREEAGSRARRRVAVTPCSGCRRPKKVLLLGGYGYTSTTGYVDSLYRRLPFEAWTYDVAADRWELLIEWPTVKDGPDVPANVFLQRGRGRGRQRRAARRRRGPGSCRVDASKPDADGTAKHGVKPGPSSGARGPHDPAWYADGVPAADPAEVDGRAEGPAGQRVGAAAHAEAAADEHGLGLGGLRPGRST